MGHIVLYDDGVHKNVLLEELGGEGLAVQSNQHLVVDGGEGMLLDPGGHKLYSKVFGATSSLLGGAKLKSLFLSHQDPDIVAAVNGWLMTTDATAHLSELWIRFVAHFGIDRLVESRMVPIPDRGTTLLLGETAMVALPAHFLHSPGNFQLYDPRSKILYSGDLGASLGQPYREVSDFDAHERYMRGFHRRYMSGNAAMRAWARRVRTLDVEIVAPQHGALFRGRAMVERFVGWCEALACGVDLLDEIYGDSP